MSNSYSQPSRRQFLHASLASLGGLAASLPTLSAADNSSTHRFKAAIIGHTGRGQYGHDMDVVFTGHPDIEVAAIADPDEAGRKKAASRSGALRQYSDYRSMLEKERPELVGVAPRWTDQHHAMIRAALETGAHVITEKPFTQSPADADDLLALAGTRGLRIAVAHQMLVAPSVRFLQQQLQAGVIGDLLAIHAHGKQDNRAGGEDMIVLGCHLFGLVRLFAGDPHWGAARILQNGHEVTRADIRQPSEDIGPILGDDIAAQFGFANGVVGSFTSRASARTTAGPWGITLTGSKGVIRILTEIVPKVFLQKQGEWSETGRNDEWRPLPGDPSVALSPAERGFPMSNRRVVDDWLDAIRSKREPISGGRAAAGAVEMICGVFQAGLERTRVSFPLKERGHPLRGR